jgi:hypothetical protein
MPEISKADWLDLERIEAVSIRRKNNHNMANVGASPFI